MILLLIGGVVLTALSVIVLSIIARVILKGQRAVAEFGIEERLPVARGSKLIIAAWLIALAGGLAMLWFYFR